MPNVIAIKKAEELLQQLLADDGSTASQAALVRQAEDVRITLQQPPDVANFYIKKGLVLIIINACVELGVFDAVPPDIPVSVDEIADRVAIAPSILSRFFRALTLEGFFILVRQPPVASTAGGTPPAPVREDQYALLYMHTKASLSLRGPQSHAWWRAALTLPIHRFWRTSAYLRSHTVAETRDSRRNGLAWAMGLEGLTFFEALERDVENVEFWKTAMESAEYGLGSFPWSELKGEVVGETQVGRVFVVDVGGGRGKALEAIRNQCDEAGFRGEMVLEDLESMLGGEKPVTIEGVTNLVYDFFAEGAEQPVKNAHVYYLRRVLHDYYDGKARQILRQVVDAMGPRSRVILCEYIMPEDDELGDDIFPYLMDFLLFMSGGMERTERQWRELLQSVDLEIVKIWRSKDNPIEGDIEIRLKGSESMTPSEMFC